MLKECNFSKTKWLNYIVLFVALACALHYTTLHYSLITDPLPLTLRESAPILISEAYAEQLADGFVLPYSVEQYPQATSVYGPMYTILTGVIQLGPEVDPYLLHRWINALLLLCASILCAVLQHS